MKRHVLVAAVVAMGIAAIAVAGCGNSLPQGAIAKVGGTAITQAQFDQYMSQAKSQASSSTPFPSPGTTQYNQYAAQLVNYLVQQQLITNEAGKLKISVSDKDITDRLTQLYQAYGGQAKVMAILKKQGMTLDQLKDLLKNQILGQKVYEQVVAKAKPTAQQISDYYNAHKSQFNQPETRDVRHVLVKTKAEAETVRALLAANNTDAEWAKVAKQYSTDPGSKKNGGSLGTVEPRPDGRPVRQGRLRAQARHDLACPSSRSTAGTSSRSPRSTRPSGQRCSRRRPRSPRRADAAEPAEGVAGLARPGQEGRAHPLRARLRPRQAHRLAVAGAQHGAAGRVAVQDEVTPPKGAPRAPGGR